MKTGDIGPSRLSRPDEILLILNIRDIQAISTCESRNIEPGNRRVTSWLVTIRPQRVATRETVDGNEISVTKSFGKDSSLGNTGRSSSIVELGKQCWTIIHGAAGT